MSLKDQLVKISDAANSIRQFTESLPEGVIKSKEDLLEIGNLGATLFMSKASVNGTFPKLSTKY